jgi:hypothetical protein
MNIFSRIDATSQILAVAEQNVNCMILLNCLFYFSELKSLETE